MERGHEIQANDGYQKAWLTNKKGCSKGINKRGYIDQQEEDAKEMGGESKGEEGGVMTVVS
jgi:hypothetical protein